MLTLCISGCQRSQEPAPARSSFATARSFVFTYKDPTGQVVHTQKDTLITAIPGQPDSTIGARLYERNLNYATGQLEQVPNFPSLAEQEHFVQLLLSDPDLRTGPDPISLHALKNFLFKANLSLADLYMVVDTTSSRGMRFFDLLDQCYKTFRTNYASGRSFGSDLDNLLEDRKLSTNGFMDAVDAAGYTYPALAQRMEQLGNTFTDINNSWSDLGDSSTRGLVRALTNMQRIDRNAKNTFLLDRRDHEIIAAGVSMVTSLPIMTRSVPNINFSELITNSSYTWPEGSFKLGIRWLGAVTPIPGTTNPIMVPNLSYVGIENEAPPELRPSVYANLQCNGGYVPTSDPEREFYYVRARLTLNAAWIYNIQTDIFLRADAHVNNRDECRCFYETTRTLGSRR